MRISKIPRLPLLNNGAMPSVGWLKRLHRALRPLAHMRAIMGYVRNSLTTTTYLFMPFSYEGIRKLGCDRKGRMWVGALFVFSPQGKLKNCVHLYSTDFARARCAKPAYVKLEQIEEMARGESAKNKK